MGLAFALDTKYEDAERCLENSIQVLEARIQNLTKMETSHNIGKEISELKVLVAEIKEKINDHKTCAVTDKIKDAGGFPGTSRAVPVSSIATKKGVELPATVGSA